MNKRIRTPLEECNNANDSLSNFRKQKEFVGADKWQRNVLIGVTWIVNPNQGGFSVNPFPLALYIYYQNLNPPESLLRPFDELRTG
ncbi:MAG: hypothetical protein AB1598_14420 [Thermodesulfobacteriota bacterium]